MKAAFVRCTVAKKGHGNLISAPIKSAQCRPDRHRNPAADNAASAQHTDLKVGNVLRAALALAIACHLAEKLRHHLRDVAAFGDDVTMPAMRTDNIVIVTQGCAYTSTNRLGPNIQMD